jgi:hypothetical protein
MFRYQDCEWQLKIPCPRCGGLPKHVSSHNHSRWIEVDLKDGQGLRTALASEGWRSGVYCEKCNLIYCEVCKENPRLVGLESWESKPFEGGKK